MKSILALLFFLPLIAYSGEHAFGWKSAPAGQHIRKSFAHLGLKSNTIKPHTDLTAGMPPIYDQGDIGSCTANAGLAAFEYAWKLQHGDFMLGSRLGLYQDELRHDGNYPQDAGSYTSTVIWVLRNRGIGLEKCWGYDTSKLAKKAPSCYSKSQAQWKLLEAYDVDNADHVSIRMALSNGFPVMFGCYVYSGIEHLPASNILPMPRRGERPIGGHEMLCVGSDDASKLYKVRNSWGTSYGLAGHLFIPFGYLENPRITEDCAVISK